MSPSCLKNHPPFIRQFLGPFAGRLWLLIVAFVLVVGLGLYFMARFDSTQNGSEFKFDLKESMWYATTVLLQGRYAWCIEWCIIDFVLPDEKVAIYRVLMLLSICNFD